MTWRSWGSSIGMTLCLALAIPAIGRAQSEAAPAEVAETPPSAEVLVEQGIAQRRAGDDRGAVDSFRRAYGLSPLPRTAAQLGLACQAVGQWVEAHERLTEALAAADDAWVARNRDALVQALGVVQAEVGTVEILVEGEVPEGARASLGGRDLGALPMAGAVVALAGEEALEVTALGHRTVRRDVRVRAGQLNRVTVALRAEDATDTEAAGAITGAGTGTGTSAGTGTGEPAADRAAPGGGEDWIVWVIVGAVAVVGVGVAIGVVASQEALEPPLPGTAGAVELLRF